jgi:mannose-6-phosphate isomerase-like protein (cupin superfamily)
VIVSGAGTLQLEDREEALEPGDVLSVDPHERHAVVSRGSVALRFVCLDCHMD